MQGAGVTPYSGPQARCSPSSSESASRNPWSAPLGTFTLHELATATTKRRRVLQRLVRVGSLDRMDWPSRIYRFCAKASRRAASHQASGDPDRRAVSLRTLRMPTQTTSSPCRPRQGTGPMDVPVAAGSRTCSIRRRRVCGPSSLPSSRSLNCSANQKLLPRQVKGKPQASNKPRRPLRSRESL